MWDRNGVIEMRYSDDTITNEQEKVKNGERTIVTDEMLNLFLGGDNTNAEAWEMLLDILNNQYPLNDAISDIKEHASDIVGNPFSLITHINGKPIK